MQFKSRKNWLNKTMETNEKVIDQKFRSNLNPLIENTLDVLTTKNVNRFSLERKIFDVKDREMMNMFWEDCKEPSFYKHICQPDNF